ncbi:MAG: glycosyltransferase [Chloroflexi bacterium]|nr:glycosyltransferase [Chloroflexota bacterium]MCI0578633.1 glycosyltransferase [Chloroflexota bacterium]MCI0647206.1 glycosyltransferase [Chloroflexota bacterium]MCI0728932.1 glycosyltransferase [Chloroflexota bacterium]
MIATYLIVVYGLAAAGISLFGLLGVVTFWLYWQRRHDSFACPSIPRYAWPAVTVQLPIYNERFVAGRLIKAAVELDYPAGRLQIQVLDDSTDDTTEIVAALVQAHRQRGVDICLHHRQQRHGYKAGALAAGLARATGRFIAVFDADFRPEPDFLRRVIPHFYVDPGLGMVQTRWGHLNPADSPLTAAQTIALDKHFVMEQTVRHRAGFFPKFNGSAGVWRRQCLEEVGGWETDTVCEDLCLSTRAILQGWRSRFLADVVAPAELPTTITAYKNQQARWAKGSTQCLRKFGRSILADPNHSLIARLYALLSMSGYFTHLLLLVLLLIQVPLVYLDAQFPAWFIGFGLAGIGQPLLFVAGQYVLYRDWWRRLGYLPALLLIAIGLAPSTGRAVLQAIFSRRHTFVRTPKGLGRMTTGPARRPWLAPGQDSYRLPLDAIFLAEALLALYAALGVALCLARQQYGSLFFLATCALGFGYVALLTLREAK